MKEGNHIGCTPIYASDLKASMLQDTWLGKGFEKMLDEADIKGVEVIVGYFLTNFEIEE